MLHSNLSVEGWQERSFFEQMANVGAEVGRAIQWRERDVAMRNAAIARGIELLDLTMADKKNRTCLKEVCRVKEVLVDYFYYDNKHGSSDASWNSYFYGFNYASAIQRHR